MQLSQTWNEDFTPRYLRAMATISGIRTKEEMTIALGELLGLGFIIDELDRGSVEAMKVIADPSEILDPKYDRYRYLARECED